MSGGAVPAWEEQKDAICARIRRDQATLKIVLKTKNERDFLARWIDHHAAIVGLRNLIVFDNGSTDGAVLEIIERINNEATVVRYDGYHNALHRTEQFPELYQSLRVSCDYFALLDTDEFLVWVNNVAEQIAPADIPAAIRALPKRDLIVGVWLDNYNGYDDRFILFEGDQPHPTGLTGGKSVISTTSPLKGMFCHNFQLDGPRIKDAVAANIMVLHMKRLLPRQRIRANMEKLQQYKFFLPKEGLEKVLDTVWEDLKPGNVRQWVKEIQNLNAGMEFPVDKQSPLRRGHLLLASSGAVRFHSEEERSRFVHFLQNPGPMLEEAISSRTSR